MPRTITLTREKLTELIKLRDEAVSAYPALAPGQAFSSACGPYLPLLIDTAAYLLEETNELEVTANGLADQLAWIGPKYATERRDELLAEIDKPGVGIPKAAIEYGQKFGLKIDEAILHYAHIVEGCPADMADGADPIFMGGPHVAPDRIEWLRARRDEKAANNG